MNENYNAAITTKAPKTLYIVFPKTPQKKDIRHKNFLVYFAIANKFVFSPQSVFPLSKPTLSHTAISQVLPFNIWTKTKKY